jgi:uncharacterized protein (DUF1697 family)
MERLRRVIKEMGFTNVETFIQSGNVLFETDNLNVDEIERQIEFGLQETLGIPVPAFVRTDREIIEISDHKPFEDAERGENHTIYVLFLHEAPTAVAVQEILNEASAVDQFHIFKNQIFWLYNRSLGESTFSNAKIEKILRVPATVRNISTLHKIAEKYR